MQLLCKSWRLHTSETLKPSFPLYWTLKPETQSPEKLPARRGFRLPRNLQATLKLQTRALKPPFQVAGSEGAARGDEEEAARFRDKLSNSAPQDLCRPAEFEAGEWAKKPMPAAKWRHVYSPSAVVFRPRVDLQTSALRLFFWGRLVAPASGFGAVVQVGSNGRCLCFRLVTSWHRSFSFSRRAGGKNGRDTERHGETRRDTPELWLHACAGAFAQRLSCAPASIDLDD